MKAEDARLPIRLERTLREWFLEMCRAQDRPAAQVIREFMREYVAEHRDEVEEPHASQQLQKKGAAAGVRGNPERTKP